MRRSISLAVCLLLVGCVAAPERRQPQLGIELPQRYAAESDSVPGPSGESWWDGFDDPRLGELIGLALDGNRDLQVAAARVERAAAATRIDRADLLPGVGVGLTAARQRTNFAALGLGGAPRTFSQYGLSLDASWEADLWGRLRAGARASLAEWQATESDLDGARLSIAAQTAKAWFAVVEATQQIRLAEKSVESFESLAGQVRSRYEQGLRPALDLRLALSNLSGAQALLEGRRAELESAMRSVELLLGRYPGGALLDGGGARGLPALPATPAVGLPAELLLRRPDLAAAERRLVATDQRLTQARRSRYPRLSLGAGSGTSGQGLGDLLDSDFRIWNVLANLTAPLFQGGRLRAAVDAAAAGVDGAEASYVAQLLRAFSEVETALAAERHLVERERHLAETSKHLIAARKLAEERYRSGLGGYLVVLESQTRALNAESQWISARRVLLQNRIDLHVALGGGFRVHSPSLMAEEREGGSS